ncbi:MAG: lambda exonuclease family protein [Pseudobdellovibrionaceae bacterium]
MIEQGSPEWLQQRAGKITASRFADVLAVLKSGKPSEARQKYQRELVFEILSGVPKQSTQASAMKWGSEIEQYAREAYEIETGNIVKISEFTFHKTLPHVGSSPDGLIEPNGGIEIKCPYDEAKHVQTLLEGMPDEHMAQIQGNMFVTDREWWDFISFDPRQAEPYRIYIQRINRDEEYIKKLQAALDVFWKETCEMVCNLKNRKVAA